MRPSSQNYANHRRYFPLFHFFAYPTELSQRIPELRIRHLVGLRFAGDAELPALVLRCLAGELKTADQVKREIREWRGDFVRA